MIRIEDTPSAAIFAGYGADGLLHWERNDGAGWLEKGAVTLQAHIVIWDDEGTNASSYRTRYSTADPTVDGDYSAYSPARTGASTADGYTDDPTNVPSDHIRLLIGDTDPNKPLLTTGQINFMLTDENGDTKHAAARCAELLAAKFSLEADDKSVGPLRYRNTLANKAERYFKLAKSLWYDAARMTIAPFAGGTSKQDKANRAADTDRTESSFRRKMMRYPIGSADESRASDEELRP